LVYLAAGPLFSRAPEFAAPFRHECGGLASYAGALLAQFDYYNLAGAARRGVEAVLIGALAERVVAQALGRPARLVRYVPLLPYCLLCGRVDQNPAAALIVIGTLAAVLAGAAGHLWSRAWRCMWHVALTALVAYALAGAAGRDGLWVTMTGFGLLATLAERRRTGPLERAWLGAFAVPPLLAAWAGGCFLPPANFDVPVALSRPTHALTLLLLAATPLAALVLTLRPSAAMAPAWTRRRPLRVLAAIGALLLTSLLAARLTCHQPGLEQAQWDDLVLAGRWDAVLARATASPKLSLLAIHDVDTALARTGRLGDDMFLYPQDQAALLLPMEVPYTFSCRFRLADQLLALGRINSAEFALQNTLPYTGDNPYILRRLALVYMVKGDASAARLYLTLLSCNLIHGGWARHYLRLMASDPQLAEEREITAARAFIPARDDLLDISDVAQGQPQVSYYQYVALADLLDFNPRNRLALDELMALYLLLAHPEGVAENLHRLGACGGREIPASWEEALLVVLDHPGGKVDLGDLTISEQSLRRFRRFKQVMRAHSGDFHAAWPDLSREFAGTWLGYYAQIGMSR
jgi:hypothetical protein